MLLGILFFGASIFVHELGHYIAAKKRKMFVPRFSIGFGPKICGFRKGETEFIISLFPLGGYVAIPQLADLKKIEGEYNLPKNLKQSSCFDKILTAFCGPLANVIFAFALSVIVYFVGLPTNEELLTTQIGYVPETLILPHGEEITSPAYQANLLPNDKILSVDNSAVHRFDDIVQFIALGNKKTEDGSPFSIVKIERDGKVFDVPVYPKILQIGSDNLRFIGVYPKQELIISGLHEQAATTNSGLQKGDKIISANGEPIFHLAGLYEIVENSGEIILEVERNGEKFSAVVPVTKLAVTKPYLTMKLLGEKTICDIIPTGNSSRSGEGTAFQIFFSDKKFTKKHRITDIAYVNSINGVACSSLEKMMQHLDVETPTNFTITTADGETTTFSTKIEWIESHDQEFEKFLGLIFEQKMVIDHPSPWQQINDTITSTVKTLESLFSKNSDVSPKHLMGPAGMIKFLHLCAKDSFPRLLWFVILINVNLAILNLLPIPVLDGGIILISALEKLTGSKYIEKIFAKLQSIFIVLFLALMAFVTFYDFKRMYGEKHKIFEEKRAERIAIIYED